MSEERQCPHCGAHLRKRRACNCEFCGHELAPRAEPVAAAASGPPTDRERRFQALSAHPELPALLAYQPRALGLFLSTFAMAMVSAVVAAFVVGFSWQVIESGRPTSVLMGVIAILVTAGFALAMITRAFRASSSELIRRPTRIASVLPTDRGTQMDIVILEDESGRRDTFKMLRSAAHTLAIGDFGVAYTRGAYLEEFQRVDV